MELSLGTSLCSSDRTTDLHIIEIIVCEGAFSFGKIVCGLAWFEEYAFISLFLEAQTRQQTDLFGKRTLDYILPESFRNYNPYNDVINSLSY